MEENMDRELAKEDARQSSERLIQIIKEEYEKSSSGHIKGYLDQRLGIVTKKEVRRIRRLEGDEPAAYDRGSVICHEPDEESRALIALYVSIYVKCDLLEEFGKYPFKKFDLDFKTVQEYRYYKNRLWRWKKTSYILPFFTIDIKW